MSVDKPEELHQDEERDEEDYDRKHISHQHREEEWFPAWETKARKSIGRGYGNQHAEHGRRRGNPHTIFQIAQELLSCRVRGGEERRVLAERWLGRKQDRRLLDCRELRLDRRREHPDHRQS